MATQVNIFEAKTNLSRLIEQVEQGEEVIIARAGEPVARPTQLRLEKRPIRFGVMTGEIWIANDFDDSLPPEIQAEFEAVFMSSASFWEIAIKARIGELRIRALRPTPSW